MVKSKRIDSFFKRKVDENLDEENKRQKVSSQKEPQSQEQENPQGPQPQSNTNEVDPNQIERDPAKRKATWEYPVNLREQIRIWICLIRKLWSRTLTVLMKMVVITETLVLRSMLANSPIVFFASLSIQSRLTLHCHHQLFTNGMRESEQRDVTLRINESEEAAFMELLNFMYSNNLKVRTATTLLDVLVIADKFDVPSCMRYCGHLLRNLPMTPESVLVYLDLPSTILTAEAFRPLTFAAKQFYSVHYKDITKYQDEIHSLPLASVEAIISSDDLKVETEDSLYKFVIEWARAHYPKIEDRREILMTRLAKFIRYPYMTREMLTNLLTGNEFDLEFAQKVVTEAISFKAEVPQRQHEYEQRFVKRSYKYQPDKMVKFEQPYLYHVVYVDLKRDVCASLFPSGYVSSEAFNLGGKGFYLSFQCSETVKTLQERSFRILLGTMEEVSISFAVDYEFAVLSKPNEKFVKICQGSYTFEVKKTRQNYKFCRAKGIIRKIAKHEKACTENQHAFVPFAFDTFGYLVPDEATFLKRVQLVVHSNSTTSKNDNIPFEAKEAMVASGSYWQLVNMKRFMPYSTRRD
ncbi:BTB/POZ domain-containing protein POB1-like [Bidens hawaiensis]|uniref:BTB/POZ domain-containing protein POB1-like n=1 Tax=Bidens hawaiensis TaxID=980011 RepID=UPI004049AC83